MSASSLPLRSPSLRLQTLEHLVLVEAWSTLPTLPLLAWARRGDGHPVLVLPGFAASDNSTWYLRNVLRAKGHATHGWRLGTNTGPHPRIVRGVERRLLALADQHGTTVSVVGWSLGGVYARELARAYPSQCAAS